MTRRQLHPFIAEQLRAAGGSREAVLRACIAAMRIVRDLASDPIDPLALELLRHKPFVCILHEEDALGQVYQALNAPALEAAYRSARQQRRKFTGDDRSAATQLFTPRWVVEFLLHNTLGRLWRQRHPDSTIALPWLIDSAETVEQSCRPARELRILDPACGTMNFGIVAAELLAAMYREEMDRAGRAGWPAEPSVRADASIAESIIRNNLHGIDIDPIALRLAAAALEMKLRAPVSRQNLHRTDALLDRRMTHRFAGACDVVVTNPPYLSARNLPAHGLARLKRAYPTSWRDAGTCFIERCLAFARAGGRTGILCMQSFMFTGSYEKLRTALLDRAGIEAIAHFGPGLFDAGNPGTLQTAAIVLRREPDELARDGQVVRALRLVDVDDKRAALRRRLHAPTCVRQSELRAIPRSAWIYWMDAPLRRALRALRRLGEIAPPRQGLATTDNTRFVRYWWEVEPAGANPTVHASAATWFAYTKAGRFRRWYEAPRHRVNWRDDGRQIKQSIVERYPYLNGKWEWVAKNVSFYGRPGVTYSYLTSGQFSARRLEPGTIFDVAGSSLFPDDPLTMLAVLNSSAARRLLAAINPTVNFQVGDLAQLPIPSGGDDGLRAAVTEAIDLQRQIDSFDETTPDFVAPPDWRVAPQIWRETHDRLADLERRIDHSVAKLYGLDSSAPSARPCAATSGDLVELARRWCSYALGRLLGRWNAPQQQVMLRLSRQTADVLRDELARLLDEPAAQQIDATLGGIEFFLTRQFPTWHARLYHRRPVLWVLHSDDVPVVVRHDQVDETVTTQLAGELRVSLPPGWMRCVDDGILVNLAPLREWVASAAMRDALAKSWAELQQGRRSWSHTGQWCAASPISRGRTCAAAPARRRSPRGRAAGRDARTAGR